MVTKEIVQLLKVLSLSQNKTVPAKGHKGSVILKSHLLVIDETSVLLSAPEGYANKCCLCDSQLNNRYLQGYVERHSNQWQQRTKIWKMWAWWAEVSSSFILSVNKDKMSRNYNFYYQGNLFDSVKLFSQLLWMTEIFFSHQRSQTELLFPGFDHRVVHISLFRNKKQT